ncbi:MAG: type I-C CRISPR-associated protein Cas7/Csd2, partial [Myxococcales bacterium]|nr:type I-C CRISPR-associated protein Cas7/Csd2 [Myxococcales bacterium]
MEPIQKRYDFALLFDVVNGNPNGDPDAGNLPRLDTETGQGLVTDVCLKRKIRNYVQLTHQPPGEDQPGARKGYDIYVREKAILNHQHQRAYDAESVKATKGKLPKEVEDANKVKDWMCGNFFDIRAFGAVMTTDVNCGQVRGPVQIAFSRSIDPVVTSEHAVTRMAVTTEKEAEKQQGDNRTM